MGQWALVGVLAAFLGVRHALAADHVTATVSFVEATGADRRAGAGFGLRLGLGHGAGMVLAAMVLLMGLHGLPPGLIAWMARAGAVWLVLLGVWIGLGMAGRRARPPWVNHFLRRPGAAWLVGALLGLGVSPGDLAIYALLLGVAGVPGRPELYLVAFVLGLVGSTTAVGFTFGALRTLARVRSVTPWLTGMSACTGVGVGIGLLTGVIR